MDTSPKDIPRLLAKIREQSLESFQLFGILTETIIGMMNDITRMMNKIESRLNSHLESLQLINKLLQDDSRRIKRLEKQVFGKEMD